VDVAPRREVHHGVGAPADRPHHFLHFLGDAGTHRAVADIGVDLDEEVAADRHRLEFDVVDVGGDDRAAARDLGAHEFRRDEFGNLGAEAVAVGEPRLGPLERRLAREILAMGDIDHLFGDDPGAGEFILRHQLTRRAPAQDSRRGTMRREALGRDMAVVLGFYGAAGNGGVPALGDPAFAHRLEAGVEIDASVRLGIGAGGIIDAHRRLVGVAERDFAERHGDVGMALGRGVDLARAGDRPGSDALRRRRRLDLGEFVHWPCLRFAPMQAKKARRGDVHRRASSLRRHDPDQVLRVRREPPSQPGAGAPRVRA